MSFARGVTAAVINFNTAALALRCARALIEAGIEKVLLLDNGSAHEDYRALADAPADAGVRIIRSEENLGFAAGSNALIHDALQDPDCERVLLVNSDAVVDASGLRKCLEAMQAGGHDLMGGRMMKPRGPGEASEVVDSLGMALYSSLLASNRKSAGDTYLGPTGGFAVFTRRFLEEIEAAHGYVFDPAYFCYAEDTDLCVRARLLGFSAGYVDDVVAHHEGQASVGGVNSDFILYHGIRNSIWMAAKSIPGRFLFTHLPFVLALHAGIVLRHLRQGRARTLWRLYRDAFAGLGRVIAQRHVVQRTRRIPLRDFAACIDPQFYETRYVKDALRELGRR